MTTKIEPQHVASAVDAYADSELRDADKYTNRQPLDETGIWSLHNLAAGIYAMGWEDATRAADERARAERDRETDRRNRELKAALATHPTTSDLGATE